MLDVFVFVGSDVSGCSDEDADDDASFLEESVALEPVVELDSDRCFLLLFLDDSAAIMTLTLVKIMKTDALLLLQ